MRFLSGISLALALVTGAASTATPQSSTPRPLHYWHVWVDSKGTSHQSQCTFKDFALLSLGKGVEPIFTDRLPDAPAHVVIAQFPKGWVGKWHENPEPQWIIPLSGRWFVETMDGHRAEMGRATPPWARTKARSPMPPVISGICLGRWVTRP